VRELEGESGELPRFFFVLSLPETVLALSSSLLAWSMEPNLEFKAFPDD